MVKGRLSFMSHGVCQGRVGCACFLADLASIGYGITHSRASKPKQRNAAPPVHFSNVCCHCFQHSTTLERIVLTDVPLIVQTTINHRFSNWNPKAFYDTLCLICQNTIETIYANYDFERCTIQYDFERCTIQ